MMYAGNTRRSSNTITTSVGPAVVGNLPSTLWCGCANLNTWLVPRTSLTLPLNTLAKTISEPVCAAHTKHQHQTRHTFPYSRRGPQRVRVCSKQNQKKRSSVGGSVSHTRGGIGAPWENGSTCVCVRVYSKQKQTNEAALHTHGEGLAHHGKTAPPPRRLRRSAGRDHGGRLGSCSSAAARPRPVCGRPAGWRRRRRGQRPRARADSRTARETATPRRRPRHGTQISPLPRYGRTPSTEQRFESGRRTVRGQFPHHDRHNVRHTGTHTHRHTHRHARRQARHQAMPPCVSRALNGTHHWRRREQLRHCGKLCAAWRDSQFTIHHGL